MELSEKNHERRVRLERTEAVVPVAEYMEACVDIPKFLGYCRECGNYGNRWSCPPFREDPMDIWTRFHTLRLIAYTLPCETGGSVSQAMADLELAKARMMEETLGLEQSMPGTLALSAGSCTLCGKDCTRPAGKPCRHPERMRYSIEALGGDVAKTAELYLNRPLLWIRDNKLPEYLTLVGGALLREREEP